MKTVLTCLFTVLLLIGCNILNDPIGDCPRPKLLFAVSEGQEARDDPNGQYFGIIQKRWSEAGDPIVFWTDNLKNQQSNLFFKIYNENNEIIKEDNFPIRLGPDSIQQSRIREPGSARAILWLESECGALSTHQIELVP